ncbi:MAG: hypothetical protein ACRD0J_06235 [Acidimicrobiales bacterium]
MSVGIGDRTAGSTAGGTTAGTGAGVSGGTTGGLTDRPVPAIWSPEV